MGSNLGIYPTIDIVSLSVCQAVSLHEMISYHMRLLFARGLREAMTDCNSRRKMETKCINHIRVRALHSEIEECPHISRQAFEDGQR